MRRIQKNVMRVCAFLLNFTIVTNGFPCSRSRKRLLRDRYLANFIYPSTKRQEVYSGYCTFKSMEELYSSEYSASIYAKNSDRHRVRDRDVQELSVRHSLLSILERTYACSVSFKSLLFPYSLLKCAHAKYLLV